MEPPVSVQRAANCSVRTTGNEKAVEDGMEVFRARSVGKTAILSHVFMVGQSMD